MDLIKSFNDKELEIWYMWARITNLMYMGKYKEMFELAHKAELLEQDPDVDFASKWRAYLRS